MKSFPKLTYFVVPYYELEKLIQNTFKVKEFSIASSEDCSNDTYKVYNVDGKICEWDRGYLDVWLEKPSSDFLYRVNLLMNHMAIMGIIPMGQYLVNISW